MWWFVAAAAWLIGSLAVLGDLVEKAVHWPMWVGLPSAVVGIIFVVGGTVVIFGARQ